MFKINYHYYSGLEVLPNLLKKDFIAPLTVLLRKSVFSRFGDFDENFRRSEDLEFFLRAAYGGANICFLPMILAKLRMRRNNNLQGLNSQPAIKSLNLKILEDLNKKMNGKERQRYKINSYIKRAAFKTVLAYLLIGDKENARKFLFKRFNNPPFFLLRVFIVLIPARLFKSFLQFLYYLNRSLKFKRR